MGEVIQRLNDERRRAFIAGKPLRMRTTSHPASLHANAPTLVSYG